MNKISEITKRDILLLFKNGLEIDELFEYDISYNYYGVLNELDFLKRLYDLEKLPSLDSRCKNALEDITFHTIKFHDYEKCWVFTDERFPICNGSDEEYLKFICEIFHPVVRDEKGHWMEFLNEVNKFLKNDRYEIYPINKISNHDVYGWKIYDHSENGLFIPFSERNKDEIAKCNNTLSINKKARNQIYQILNKYDDKHYEIDEYGYDYEITTSEMVFGDMKIFYEPKCFDYSGKYVKTNNLKDFILDNYPYFVFDAIELFEKYNKDNDFSESINIILANNKISYVLSDGKIESKYDMQFTGEEIANINEAGVKELLQEAIKLKSQNNINIAVEKLWDAFERLKTYYYPTLNKKQSVDKVIRNMSNGNDSFFDVFETEFNILTTIGNNFRIRHHEKNKIDIQDERHYEYFYKRCYTLISTAIEYLE